jgi:hypothetical protein
MKSEQLRWGVRDPYKVAAALREFALYLSLFYIYSQQFMPAVYHR